MTGKVSTSGAGPGRLGPDGAEPVRRHHPFFYIGGTFLNAVVFAAVGPVVGGPVFTAIGMVVAAPSNPAQGSSVSNFFMGLIGYFYLFFFTIPVSYYFATSAAFATGAIVAVFSVWLTYSRYLYLAAAIAGGIVSVLEVFRYSRTDEATISFYAAAIAGAIAAMVCTRATKPFRLGVPVPPEPADGLSAK